MAGVIDTTYTFTPTDTVSSTKLNTLSDGSFFTNDAVIGTTLVVATGKLKINAAGITSNELANNSVTGSAITDGSVLPAKLSLGRINWNDWVSDGAKVSTTTLAFGRGSSQSGETRLNFRASDGVVNTTYDSSISRASGNVGVLTIDNVYDPADTTTVTRGQINFNINGLTKLSIRQDGAVLLGTAPLPTPTGTAPMFGMRAWGRITSALPVVTITGSATRMSGSTTVTCTGMTSHGFVTNDVVYVEFASGILSGVYAITKLTNDSFTLQTTSTGSDTTAATITTRQFNGGNIKAVTGGKVASNKGFYAICFTVPMNDTDYSIVGSSKTAATSSRGYSTISMGAGAGFYAKTVNGIGFNNVNIYDSSAFDASEVHFHVIR